MSSSGEGRDRWLWIAVWGTAALVVAVLAAAAFLFFSGEWGRKAQAPAPPPPQATNARPHAPRKPKPKPAPREAAPPSATKEAPAPAFEGKPLSWGVGTNQTLFFQEPVPPGSRAYLVVMSPEREVLGTLYLNLEGTVLPSRYLIKDASWGQTKRFGGDDVLLGVVACSVPPNGSAFQRAASDESWWQGKLKPAFQMNY